MTVVGHEPSFSGTENGVGYAPQQRTSIGNFQISRKLRPLSGICSLVGEGLQ